MNAPALINHASAYAQLRPAEKSFVDAYVDDLHRSALERNERISLALYRPIPTAVVEASRGYLESPLVLAAVTERIMEIARDSELTVARVVREITCVSFASMGDYFKIDDLGNPSVKLENLTDDQWRAVESIEFEMDTRNPLLPRKTKIKLHNKLTAINMLAQYTGMFDADRKLYQRENATPAKQLALPDTATVESAGDRYAAMING